jgi:hypothetical protein
MIELISALLGLLALGNVAAGAGDTGSCQSFGEGSVFPQDHGRASGHELQISKAISEFFSSFVLCLSAWILKRKRSSHL